MTEYKKPRNNKTIICRSITGRQVEIPVNKLVFRNSVYGIVIHRKQILLVRTKTTGHYAFPGGGIQVGEPIKHALTREIHEETGIQVQIGDLLHFEEDFFYYDPGDIAFHSFLFFYECSPLTTDLVADEGVIDMEAEKPRWVSIKDVNPDDFLVGVQKALSIALKNT